MKKEFIIIVADKTYYVYTKSVIYRVIRVVLDYCACNIVYNGLNVFDDFIPAKMWALVQYEDVYRYGNYEFPDFVLHNMSGFSRPDFGLRYFESKLVKIDA